MRTFLRHRSKLNTSLKKGCLQGKKTDSLEVALKKNSVKKKAPDFRQTPLKKI